MPEARGSALIVTLGRARGALAATRALAEAGWSVGVGTPDCGGMVGASRGCAATHRVPRPRGDGRDFVEAVRLVVEANGYDVVFGGADDWMAALAHYRDALPVTVAHPDAETVARALDKLDLTRYATEVGLAAPHTVVADEGALRSWSGPVVVKCRHHWFPGQCRQLRIEAQGFADAAEARSHLAAIHHAGFEAVLQAPVMGQLSALVGLFHEGRLHGRVHQVSSGLWPTPSGVSSRATTVPVDEELAAQCERLLARIGWHGLVELQFLSGDDGRPQLIDLNGRFYGSLALANAAGPNLPDAWACRALGLPVPPLPDAEPGHDYLWAAGDLRRAMVERRGGLVRDVASTFLRAHRSTTSVWDASDPGPMRELAMARWRRREDGAA